MRGTLSGIIPRVNYARENLTVDGALLFKVFNGTAVVKNLSLFEPFGWPAPGGGYRHAASGSGASHADVLLWQYAGLDRRGSAWLQLSNWKPVVFDARVASSAGDYPRKISQKAVQNISAWRGGAAAAIQRSFLGIFEQFGYAKLGLSCKLLNGVCLMTAWRKRRKDMSLFRCGIPAISVIGYNRHVSWQELLDRLARITQSNVKPSFNRNFHARYFFPYFFIAGTGWNAGLVRHHQYLFPAAAAEKQQTKSSTRCGSSRNPSRNPPSPPPSNLPSEVNIMNRFVTIIALLAALVTPIAATAAADLEINTPAISALKNSMQQRHNALAPHYASGALGLARDGTVAVRDAVPFHCQSGKR